MRRVHDEGVGQHDELVPPHVQLHHVGYLVGCTEHVGHVVGCTNHVGYVVGCTEHVGHVV